MFFRGDTPSYAYGKRQRLREAGLWLIEEDAYYEGNFLTIHPSALLPARPEMVPLDVDGRTAIDMTYAEDKFRRTLLREMFGLAMV